ncbi:MAG: hypothetical protein DRR16_15045 [Candidatus Parabeggiatoa sp. nov. 3]|jgi:hypothetical protein|nr:MAG: hypothetical protein DRR00_08650 [Gammaproteobacteria bacterium]RKZ57977.1 MAG: hypothetical protein DRQ99_26110 [Gammaproteobacteria bacterium]RKZ84303.1 MAG: hypothetical protein DRR16_15045 [Gammaproteobacteria bacterium]
MTISLISVLSVFEQVSIISIGNEAMRVIVIERRFKSALIMTISLISVLSILEDLQKIMQLVLIDLLITTHSPGIISDRWDLTVELKERKT